MSFELLILLVVVFGFLLLFWFMNKKLSFKPQVADQSMIEWLKTMQVSLETTNKNLNQVMNSNSHHMVRTLQENSKQLNDRLDNAAKVISAVQKNVGEMSEIGRGFKELQDFMKNPKMRGNIGEEVLKDLIAQMIPKNSFHLQYQFKTGDRVDAAIQTDSGILPIDAKFPMENFQRMSKAETESEKQSFQKEFSRDVKKHVDAISKKYILPDEGTMDFALMYIPSESVFYEVIGITELVNYARKSRVFIVSPSTMYAHLQTILLSFEGKKIESKSKEVFKLLRAAQIDFEKVQDNMLVLGKHLSNASSQFTNVSTGFSQLGNKLQTSKMIEEQVVEELEDQNTKTLVG